MSDCETSREQVQSQSSAKTYKRRSAVFQHVARRVEEDSINNEEEEDEGRENCSEIIKEKEEQIDLPTYISKLRNERKAWKETLTARKSKRRALQKQQANLQRRKVDFDLDILSEYERSFLTARPRYEQICKNINILADAAIKIATLNREIDVLNDRLTIKIEEKLVDATKSIIDMSDET